jgi:hypothetical protein
MFAIFGLFTIINLTNASKDRSLHRKSLRPQLFPLTVEEEANRSKQTFPSSLAKPTK